MKSVQSKSQAVGEFLDLFCAEKGLTLCTFRAAGNNGESPRRWKAGVKVAKRDGRIIASRKPNVVDVFNGDAEDNPDYEEWPDQYLPCNQSIEKLLAECFKINLNKVEAERRAILAHLRGDDE